MKNISIALFLCISSLSLFASVEKRLDAVIKPQVGERIVGLVVGIYDKGTIKFLSYGKIRKKLNKTPSKNTFFEIGSITKTFTSLLLSRAIEKGLATPGTKLSMIRDEWKNESLGMIKLLELATHRSGLPRIPCDFHYSNPHYPFADYTQEELIKSIYDKTIASSSDCIISPYPSGNIQYSNWGASILGNAISYKFNSSYPKALKSQITDPLKLKDTVVKLTNEQKSRLAQGHTHKKQVEVGISKRSSMYGSGAIRSTPSDMMKYLEAMLYPGKTDLEKSLRRVRKTQFENGVSRIAYNWFVTSGGNIWHNGMTSGYSSMIKIYLKKEFGVFYLSNTATSLNCFIAAVENIPCDPMTGKNLKP